MRRRTRGRCWRAPCDEEKRFARGLRPRVLRRMRGDSVIDRAAERYGTPLYLYDFDVIERQVARLRRALGPRFTLAYAIKANPSLAVLSFFFERGLGADVASRGELLAGRRAGCPPSKILSTGPAKSDADLEALVRARVSIIHAEGEWELERLEKIAKRARRTVRVGLRLNPPWGIAEKRVMIGGSGAKKFGFDLASAARVLRRKKSFPHLEICGFQVFNASNVLGARLLVENTRRVLALALSLSKKFDVSLRTVDFGGGFGVPYAENEKPLDLAILRNGLAGIAKWAAGESRFRGTRFVFEPGRFLVAEAGVYVVKVLGTKKSRGVDYVLVGRARGRTRSLPTLSRKSLVLAGPLCTSLDVLHPAARLPLPERGDLLAFENAGAYGYTESMPLFLSHEWPAEVGVRKGRLALLRRPPRVADLQARQKTPF